MQPSQQIAGEIRKLIFRGDYAEGSVLPPRPDLAIEFGVDEHTITRAVAILQAQGLVKAKRRHGTVVLKPSAHELISLGSTVNADGQDLWLAEVFRTFRPVLPPETSPGPAPADVARLLDVIPDDAVLVREGLLFDPDDTTRRVLTYAYFPMDLVDEVPELLAPDLNVGRDSGLLEDHGHGPLTWHREIGARAATPQETRQLKMPAGSPVLTLLYSAADPLGRVCKITSAVMDSARFRIGGKLTRGKERRSSSN